MAKAVYKETVLKVWDNSGAKLVKCIGLSGGLRGGAQGGQRILTSVQSAIPGTVGQGEIFKAVIVCTRARNRRGVRFDQNAVVLVRDKGKAGFEMVGTRVMGATPRASAAMNILTASA